MADAATTEHHTDEATGAAARIARVYADALMRAAAQTGEADAVGDELAAVVASALTDKPEVAAFFASAAIHKTAKLPVLAAAFEHGTSATFRKFVGVLNQNGRLGTLPAVNAEYQKLRDAAAGRVRVRVTSAVPLDPGQYARLEAALARKVNGTPVVTVTVDPDILGGLVVQVGDTVTDTSVRTRLDNLRTHLTTSGTHG